MLEFETKVKKWGNSYGLLIPKQQVKAGNIKEEQELHVIVINKNKAIKESFGMLKGWKSGQNVKDQLRRELHER